MIIKSLSYWHHSGKPEAWKIDNCLLHPALNLIVGKNASGKTRLITIIAKLAALLSVQVKPLFFSANWEVVFESDSQTKIHYRLLIEEGKVQEEKVIRSNEILLTRDSSGKGQIWAEQIHEKIAFQIETSEIAALKKYDSIQHPFLKGLSEWASSLKLYSFATDFGRNTYAKPPLGIDLSSISVNESEKDPNRVVALYQDGFKKFGEPFFTSIKKDMEFIGYELDSITVELVKYAPVPSLYVWIPLQGLYIKEQDLPSKIPQLEISQGMFRALALIIHFNYLQFSSSSEGCILIDDIGEGLDFDRASKLIKLIIQKLSSASGNLRNIQVIMSSNDRFVMNGVPLDYWLLIERVPGGMKIYSKQNSPEIFQEFEFTGLNNFDFLASEFFKG